MRPGQLSYTHSRTKHGIASGEGVRALAAASALVGILSIVFVGLNAHFSAPPSPASPQQQGAETRRTGSILFFPWTGDICEKRRFDNRTGQILPNGYVNCETELASSNAGSTAERRDNTVRMQAILDAFKK